MRAKFLYTNTQKKSKLYLRVGVTVVTKLPVTSSSYTKLIKDTPCQSNVWRWIMKISLILLL
ncbi:hypothetical protein NPIRD3C_1029 [Nitrosopumilus piranensis]|uniref:Uncharacterized protein n=1 Tax=Nitrosopumilus piranensis TaxID=1582439 RepID=A0A0C5BVF6_9ARCH|nr:hypothetical protein NPIRD3C_1029 [Nitrosopumilus piranensis]